MKKARPKTSIEILRSDTVLPKGLPFPDGVRVGSLVILSGQIGVLPGTLDLAPGGIEGETRQMLRNIEAVLAAHKLSLQNVIRVQVMLADMAEWSRFNAVYREFFPDARPARCAFGTSGLALGARVEVEVFAAT